MVEQPKSSFFAQSNLEYLTYQPTAYATAAPAVAPLLLIGSSPCCFKVQGNQPSDRPARQGLAGSKLPPCSHTLLPTLDFHIRTSVLGIHPYCWAGLRRRAQSKVKGKVIGPGPGYSTAYSTSGKVPDGYCVRIPTRPSHAPSLSRTAYLSLGILPPPLPPITATYCFRSTSLLPPKSRFSSSLPSSTSPSFPSPPLHLILRNTLCNTPDRDGEESFQSSNTC